MSPTEQQNKAFVLEAFETLFNKRGYVAAERYWSPSYIQHSAHIPPGRDGLFELVKAAPTRSVTRTGSSSPTAITCCSTAASPASDNRRTGLWWTSCASKTANWPSTGT